MYLKEYCFYFTESAYACNEPNKIPHGVIISQEPKEVYAANSQLEYVCEDGYTTGYPNNRKTIICRSGTWTPKPSCSKLLKFFN